MEDHASYDSGLSAAYLTEEKAVWHEVSVKADFIRIRPLKVVTEKTCQLFPHQAILNAFMESGGIVKYQLGPPGIND